MVTDNPELVRCISNLRRFHGVATGKYRIVNEFRSSDISLLGVVVLFIRSFGFDVLVWNSETRRPLLYCMLRFVIPWNRCKIVLVDYILQKPAGAWQRFMARLKGALLSRVDRFVLHFKETGVYQTEYGIPASRCVYVPFKVNMDGAIAGRLPSEITEEYVFTAGRSFRDFSTFIEAMRRVGYPGLLLYESSSVRNRNKPDFDLQTIPTNLCARENIGERSWVDPLLRAKLVVVPLLPTSGYAPGLSLYLMAMALKKCVIISDVPSNRDLLTCGEAIIVPPCDPEALGRAISSLWEDDKLRARTAKAGYEYARSLGGESRLLADLADICGELVSPKD